MRMGILICRAAVGCPARVGNRHVALGGRFFQELAEVGQLACPLEDFDLFAVFESDAGAGVAPILESLQLVEDDFDGVSGADIAGNATHGMILANGITRAAVPEPSPPTPSPFLT